MAANELIDLRISACVVGTEGALVNRLDTGTTGVKSSEAVKRRLVGLQIACANTGYVVGRIDQQPVVTIDMALANGLDQVIPLDIDIPVGQELKFAAQSSSGTAACAAVAHVERGG